MPLTSSRQSFLENTNSLSPKPKSSPATTRKSIPHIRKSPTTKRSSPSSNKNQKTPTFKSESTPQFMTAAHREWNLFYKEKYNELVGGAGFVSGNGGLERQMDNVTSEDSSSSVAPHETVANDHSSMEEHTFINTITRRKKRRYSGTDSLIEPSEMSPSSKRQQEGFSQRVAQLREVLNAKERQAEQNNKSHTEESSSAWSENHDEHQMLGIFPLLWTPNDPARILCRRPQSVNGQDSLLDINKNSVRMAPQDEHLMNQLLSENSEGLHMLEELSSRMSNLELSIRDNDSGVIGDEPSSILSSNKSSPPKSGSTHKKDSKHVEELYEIIGYLERRLEQERKERGTGMPLNENDLSASFKHSSQVHNDKIAELKTLLNEERERWNRERIDLIRQVSQQRQKETQNNTSAALAEEDLNTWKQQYQTLLAKYQRQSSQVSSIRKQLTGEIFELMQKNNRLQEENALLEEKANKKSSEDIMEYKKKCILLNNDLELEKEKTQKAKDKANSLESELEMLAEERQVLARSNKNPDEQIRGEKMDNSSAEIRALMEENNKLRIQLRSQQKERSTALTSISDKKLIKENTE
eukprot:CAMPEP_0117448472 /NCGR_PEP_ID=MMETSP0759-20121206/7417_1 /TAXON_ID=63605 /ORGANISM="Percolomonas cosmopolitus, Strain WS" /LENGTH=582 /DNA_ID=CAMNT_0005240857 /DNA_START=12 /DNA_END=1759 /DNA_ORIENTATION=-